MSSLIPACTKHNTIFIKVNFANQTKKSAWQAKKVNGLLVWLAGGRKNKGVEELVLRTFKGPGYSILAFWRKATQRGPRFRQNTYNVVNSCSSLSAAAGPLKHC